jgi:hypothetical protein
VLGLFITYRSARASDGHHCIFGLQTSMLRVLDPGLACVCVLRALVPFFFEGAAISGDASEVSHGATNFTTDLAAMDDL